MKNTIQYQIYSQNKSGTESEGTGIINGKWSLIWFLIKNKFNKSPYQNRQKLEIILYKK